MPEVRVKFIPSFEGDAMKQFAQELSSTMKGGGGAEAKVSASAGSVAGIASIGALAGGGTMAAIEMLVEEFKPLAATVKNIVNVLMQFLRPIADVITVLLQPILFMLRPLLQIFNQIFAPYRQAAMQLTSESAQAMASGNVGQSLALSGLAAAVLLKPFSDILTQLGGSIVSLLIDAQVGFLQSLVTLITNIAAAIAGIFSSTAALKIKTIGDLTNSLLGGLADMAKTAIQLNVDTINNEISATLQVMAKALGSNVIIPTISDTTNPQSIASAMAGALKLYASTVGDVIKAKTFNEQDANSVTSSFITGLGQFESSAKKGINSMFDRLSKQIATPPNSSSGGVAPFSPLSLNSPFGNGPLVSGPLVPSLLPRSSGVGK